MKVNGQFVPHRIDMLKSPAFGAMSLSGRRVLDRLEIEYAGTAGKDNGKLICPHQDFRTFGVHRDAVGPAIREIEALGFIAVNRGTGGTGKHKAPSTYRLTYLPAAGNAPTDEWRTITTAEQAETIATTARKATPKNSFRQSRKPGPAPVPETVTTVVPETVTGETAQPPVPETVTTI